MHRATIDKHLNGEIVKDTVLNESLIFFYEQGSETGVLGIRGNVVGTFDLFIPTDETREDLRLIDRWYEQNRHRLRWDTEAEKVIVVK